MADGFKYASSHEYVNVDGDVATVGISDFAQVWHGWMAAAPCVATVHGNKWR